MCFEEQNLHLEKLHLENLHLDLHLGEVYFKDNFLLKPPLSLLSFCIRVSC